MTVFSYSLIIIKQTNFISKTTFTLTANLNTGCWNVFRARLSFCSYYLLLLTHINRVTCFLLLALNRLLRLLAILFKEINTFRTLNLHIVLKRLRMHILLLNLQAWLCTFSIIILWTSTGFRNVTLMHTFKYHTIQLSLILRVKLILVIKGIELVCLLTHCHQCHLLSLSIIWKTNTLHFLRKHITHHLKLVY
jgi:hypothetical protein